jgi:hypothetical protein
MLETRVCQNLRVSSFGRAAGGDDFLAFINKAQPETKTTTHPHWTMVSSAVAAPRRRVVSLTHQVRESRGIDALDTSSVDNVVLAALGCPRATAGTGHVVDPTAAAAGKTDRRVRSALALWDVTVSGSTLATIDPDSVIEEVSAAPILVDLHGWLQWDARSPPCSLLDYLTQHLPLGDAKLEHLQFLEHRGSVVRVDPTPSKAALTKALALGQAREAAGQLISFGTLDGFCGTPYALLQSSVSKGLSERNDMMVSAVRVLSEVPPWGRLRGAMAQAMLPPLAELHKVPGGTLFDQMLAACRAEPDRDRLCAALVDIRLWTAPSDASDDSDFMSAVAFRAASLHTEAMRAGLAHAPSEGVTSTEKSRAQSEPADAGGVLARDGQAATADTATAEQQENSCGTPPTRVDESEGVSNAVAVVIKEEAVQREEECHAFVQTIYDKRFRRPDDDKNDGLVDRCLEKIAMTLNSDDTHFVLELIQNADDNQCVIPLASCSH